MRCEECGQSPVVSHQWRLCKDCNLEEIGRIDLEFRKVQEDEHYQLVLPFPVPERSNFESTAEEIGRLVADKQKAYGDSFGKAGKILEILYPHGIALDQYSDVLTIVRIVDKLFRIATDKDAMGESPWRDVNGYSLLAYIRDQKRGKQ